MTVLPFRLERMGRKGELYRLHDEEKWLVERLSQVRAEIRKLVS